ncbi:predicted protein [Uncinocarpus reesii 1704]|uniref:Uncharacterized protein n=1 Tax=Uncinocarpus reesii (strain UAMH 1704) TaxID=336963 RepID=C4JNM0_UNCRE|nr:uncharacterized protein UREG_03018 [Uncinocarpus reesii 1704]EEP78173.1 predicted protein [Uncinocarpus reesii 1704]
MGTFPTRGRLNRSNESDLESDCSWSSTAATRDSESPERPLSPTANIGFEWIRMRWHNLEIDLLRIGAQFESKLKRQDRTYTFKS